MYGPAQHGDQLPALRRAWAEAASPRAQVAAGLELAKLGDFAARAELLELLCTNPTGLERAERLHLLDVVLAIATEEEATDDRLFELPDHDDGSHYLRLAGSGRRLLARTSIRRYVELAHVFDDIHDVTFELATDSGFDLSGVEFDLYDEDSTVDAWAEEMRSATEDLSATYVFRGAAFTPQAVVDELREGVERAVAGGRVLIRPDAELLAVWSGVQHPRFGEQLGPDDAAAFTEYSERVLSLPWRPGSKYFYGHDVDGGPGLNS